VLEVVDTHHEVEPAFEVELGHVTLLEPAVGQAGPPCDLIGALDQIGLELDPEHPRLGMPFGQLE
jgi:hypothetical protein